MNTRPDDDGQLHNQPYSLSRSPSRTPRMRPTPISRTIDETFNPQGPMIGLGRPRGHSTSSLRPPILQQAASSSSASGSSTSNPHHHSHVSFPTPTAAASQTTSPPSPRLPYAYATVAGEVGATSVARVVSSPLPFPYDNDPRPSRPATGIAVEQRPGRGRGRSLSLSRFKRSHSHSGSEDLDAWASLRKFAPFSSSFRRSRPGTSSDADTRSVKSINVAEVMSHRIMSESQSVLEPSFYRRAEGAVNGPNDDNVFAWTIAEHTNNRTVDTGYGFDEQSLHQDENGWREEEEPQARNGGDQQHEGNSRYRHGYAPDEHVQGQEQREEALRRTAEKVKRATSYLLDGAHEVLAVGAEVLEFAPFPGLAQAARVLLDIWDAVQMVDMNKKRCLRLTERCAAILISVREEIAGADSLSSPKRSPTLIGSPGQGHLSLSPKSRPLSSPGSSDSGSGSISPRETTRSSPGHVHNSPRGRHTSPKYVGSGSPRLTGSPHGSHGRTEVSPGRQHERLRPVADELNVPLERLIAAFDQVLVFLLKQNKRPFLQRYLKRDVIQEQLAACDASLTDALSMFSVSIQVRILKQVLRGEQKQAEVVAPSDHISHTPPRYTPPFPCHDSIPPPLTTPGFRPGLASPQQEDFSDTYGGGLLLHSSPHHDAQAELNLLDLPGLPALDDAEGLPAHLTFPEPVHYPANPPPPLPPVIQDPSKLSSQEVLDVLSQLAQVEDFHDLAHDVAARRQFLRNEVAKSDDAERLEVLQVRKDEIRQAVKALQRALEGEITKGWEAKEQAEELTTAAEHSQVLAGDQLWTSPIEDSGTSDTGPDAVAGVESLVPSDHPTPVETRPRTHTVDTTSSQRSRSGKSDSSHVSRDTLDREFIESSIEALVRLSASEGVPPAALGLPSWTITRYELIRDTKVGEGFFSEVWRGSYRGRTVAIKVLASWTPKEMFAREVLVWNELRHPNVLELIGASACDQDEQDDPHRPSSGTPSRVLTSSMHSALTGLSWSSSGWDVPEEARSPWFFVSRFYARGSLIKWIKGVDKRNWELVLDNGPHGVLKLMHEIVRGMVYLHDKGILHGDLKGSNILVNDFGHCIISDFGQSEIKTEACRVSGVPVFHGTLRWQAPEVMSGDSHLTPQVDVYAFAMTCIEILTKGGVAWPTVDDDTIRHFVLKEDRRPEIPIVRPWSSSLAALLNQCWARAPLSRPSFSRMDQEFTSLRKALGWNGADIVQDGELEHEREWEQWIDGLDRDIASPPLTPTPFPTLPLDVMSAEVPTFPTDSNSFVTARGTPPSSTAELYPMPPATANLHGSISAPALGQHPPPLSPEDLPPLETHSSRYSSRASSIAFAASTDQSDDVLEGRRSVTPPPANPRVAEIRNERRYRLSLQHEYHPSLILPLWTPGSVALGAVGYHRKPSGTFVTLFNAFAPVDSTDKAIMKMSSINGYVRGSGAIAIRDQKFDKRTAAQRGWDKIQSWLPRGKGELSSPRSVARHYSAPLRNGHKASYLFTESSIFRFIDDLSAPKRWFQANVEEILRVYGPSHPIQREDILLVIGTLDAANYALFVSHHHPDSQVNLNVFTPPRSGQPWGKFSVSTDLLGSAHGGPSYHEESPSLQSASKISLTRKNSANWDTVLVARLRFAPDKDEPTSL